MIQIHPLTTSLPRGTVISGCALHRPPENGSIGLVPNCTTVGLPLLFPRSVRSWKAARFSRGTTLHRTSRLLRRSRTLVGRLCRRTSRRHRLILGCTLRLYLLRNKAPVFRETSFHQRLRLIHKRIRQRIAADITHRQRLSLALQYKIHPPRHPVDAPRLNRAAYPQTVSPGIAL